MSHKGKVLKTCSDVLAVLTNSQNKKIQEQDGVVSLMSSANRINFGDYRIVMIDINLQYKIKYLK